MDPKVNKCRSLPPFVEGKIYGYLNLVVDEVVWARNNPGDVKVIASWWGEQNKAQFRPSDITKDSQKLEDTEETYTIKTNFQLFEDYIKNCESLELTIKAEKTNKVIGTARVTDLLDIFKSKPFTRYFPIVDKTENRIGSIHVSIKLTDTINMEKLPVKAQNNKKNEIDKIVSVDKRILNKQTDNILNSKDDYRFPWRNAKEDEKIYRSILKEKRIEFVEPDKKFNFEIPERLVDQTNPRTKKLKSALLKKALMDESYIFNAEKFLYENYHPDVCPEREAKLYEYFLGKEMNYIDECAALETLRSTSPTPSLIEFATESIHCCQHDNIPAPERNKTTFLKNDLKDEIEEVKVYNENPVTEFKTRVISPLDYVDSLRIIVRSLILTPAGYRRVKSSCLARADGASTAVTFFVQYDSIPTNPNELKKKCMNEKKPVKMTSRKQVDQEIYFNHQGIYNISKSYAFVDSPLKFKVFHRHLNQRSPTLLGMGSMYVNDVVATKNLSMTQRVAIINKGIKVGELVVTVELGCDGVHFGKEFVDAVTSTKENIPVVDSSPLFNTKVEKFKTVTGTQSNSNSGVSSVSSRRIDCISNESNPGTNDGRTLLGRRKQNEDRNVEIMIPDNKIDEKVLLHGLIYIAEGRDLPESNTYLICRAFWREDRAVSRICANTKNPLYHFHQLVPLIHGPDLLERTKNNFIVTEVYSKTSAGDDNLLGIAKFPLHQLYVAYRDPHVLPHLLLSKYPVISVDGWVPIKDPVSGQSRGKLLGLVALGTADQIALLEMTRGIRDSVVTPHMPLKSTEYPQQTHQTIPNLPLQNSPANQGSSEVEIQTTQSVSSRNEECQTEISTLEEFKNTDPTVTEASDALKNQSKVLHTIVDCLAQALHVSRTNINQASQTESVSNDELKKRRTEVEPLCLDPLSASLSDNSSNGSPRNNFTIPTEMYRSVGVGAEFDDLSNQGSSNNFNGAASQSSRTLNPLISEQMESNRLHYEDLSFRAMVEIECALHLPKVEKTNTAVEPSTYVTFEGAPSGSERQLNSYIITNVCPRTCNPRWEWRCDTRLPADLLTNDEKRLILKVWRLLEPDTCIEVDLEKDIVIGFAAMDLSVLTAGFPLVSGWFHIMDFTGKCNGQIKVSITPLESTTTFGKSISSTSVIKMLSEPSQSNQSNQSPPLPKTMRFHNIDCNNSANFALPIPEHFNYQSFEEPMDIGLGFGDASLSILSQSLKQKLTELDEITKRLQSRLHDVTENAFEDEFDNDFETNGQSAEHDCNGVQTVKSDSPKSVDTAIDKRETWPASSNTNHSLEINSMSHRDQHPSSSNEFRNHRSASSATNTITMDTNFSDTGYSTSYNIRSAQYFSNDRSNTHSVNSSDREEEHPIKGTKMHVNHLLDKLSSQLNTPPSAPIGMLPKKINIMELLSNLQPNNNNNYFQSDRSSHDQFNRSQEVFNRRTQEQTNSITQSAEERHFHEESTQTPTQSLIDNFRSETVSSTSQNRNKISNVIREELAQEEGNDSIEYDELSTHLMATNVRHVDVDSVFNPLLYQHLLPDVQLSPNSFSCSVSQDVQNRNATPEGEAVQELDNRYTESFNAAINSGLSRLRNLIERNALANSDNNSQNQKSLFENENSEVFRSTPAGVSEDVDGNIDVTVIHRPSIDELMASNSSESVNSVSIDKLPERQTETDNENTLTSSESSASTISRQAPDGGNPVEEADKRLSRKRNSQTSESES